MEMGRRKLFAWILIGGGVLLLAAVVSILLMRQPMPVLTATPASVAQVERASLVDAKSAYDNKAAVFLDVRPANSYEADHIPGAVSIPLNELSARASELDPGAWIIPY